MWADRLTAILLALLILLGFAALFWGDLPEGDASPPQCHSHEC